MSERPVRQRRLGRELRRLRQRTTRTGEDAAVAVGLSKSMVSLFETGGRVPRESDLAALLDLYGATEGERNGTMRLYEDAKRRDWLSDRADILSVSFRNYLALEPEAIMIRQYEPQYVPGLLQISAYARAMFSADPENVDRVDRLASVRLQRQQILLHDDPPQCEVVIDESALRRPVGGTAVLREQLLRLGEIAERPNIVVQIHPYDSIVFAGGPFSVLRLPEPGGLDAVFLENLAAETFLDDEADIHSYRVGFRRLQQAALDPNTSVERIIQAAEELGADD